MTNPNDLARSVQEGFFRDSNAVKRNLFEFKNAFLQDSYEPQILGDNPLGTSVAPVYDTNKGGRSGGYYPDLLREKTMRIKSGIAGSASGVSVLFPLSHIAKNTCKGTYTFSKTNSLVMPPQNTAPGELMLSRKRLTVCDTDRLTKGHEYTSKIMHTATNIGDALISVYDDMSSASYLMDIARINDYGKVISFKHARESLLNCSSGLIQENNCLPYNIVTGFQDVKKDFADYDDYPVDWDPVGKFIQTFMPCGLFLNETDTYAADSGVATYRITIANSGDPNYAGDMACYSTTGWVPSHSFSLIIPEECFVDLDQDSDPYMAGMEFNLYLLVIRKNSNELDMRLVKSRHTAIYVKNMAYQSLSGPSGYLDYQSHALEKIGRYTPSCGDMDNAINQPDFGLLHLPRYSAIFRLGYVPKTPCNMQQLNIVTDKNNVRWIKFEKFIIDLGKCWE